VSLGQLASTGWWVSGTVRDSILPYLVLRLK